MLKKMFVWENANGVSSNYHDDGGVMIIADNLDVARQLFEKTGGTSKKSEVLKCEPDYMTSVVSEEDKIFIFPNAGCC
jgi:hypothetical protein